MNRLLMLAAFFLFLSLTITSHAALPLFNLSTTELFELDHPKKLIIKSKKIRDTPWPEMTFYSTINTTPENAISILSAYSHQKNYIPDLLQSKPIKKVTPTDTHVSYKMRVIWPFPDTHYVTGNIIKKVSKFNYELKWYLVKSESIKKTYGSAKFISFRGKTLMEYTSFVDPDSSLASLVTKQMKKNLINTVKAIIGHIEKTVKNDPGMVKKYRTAFLNSLK